MTKEYGYAVSEDKRLSREVETLKGKIAEMERILDDLAKKRGLEA